MEYIAALDQGTTGSRAIIFDRAGRVVSMHDIEFRQIFPKPGWVEHDPEDIWESQAQSFRRALEKAGIAPRQIAAIGIANQRETTILWDARTGEPIYNAVVWQCRRTSRICEQLIAQGREGFFRERTGLPVDAYFSATKICWLLDNVPGARERAEAGELRFGTVDSYLLWRLTGGRVHATDVTNASRTMLMNLRTLDWDDEILRLLDIPRALLPRIADTCGIFGYADEELFGARIPIAAMAGDQQAALFGQRCVEPGAVKNTYGTGCFALMNTGESIIESRHRLISTVAWRMDGRTRYALEGSVFVGGAVVQWLRDELRIIDSAAQTCELALSVPDSGGVTMVPAFTGLGAPHWDMNARGAILGITRGTNRAHIVRAALEAIAFQSHDVIEAMAADCGARIALIKADGGASQNEFLMQFQADVCAAAVARPGVIQTTALGAAMFAGLAVKFWSEAELNGMSEAEAIFTPRMGAEEVSARLATWRKAVGRSLDWI